MSAARRRIPQAAIDRSGGSLGTPEGKLQQLGSIMNRRGTSVRFKPDAQIFGDKARFKPSRLMKMARLLTFPTETGTAAPC